MQAKKILVISDTHRHREAWQAALARAGSVDMVFHLGDHVSDAVAMADALAGKAKVVAVRGNCDFSGDAAEEEVVVCGHRFWLTHGHNYGVKYSLQRLCYAAEEKQVDAVLFGHTHVPTLEYYGGILVLNPGSVGEPRGRKATFALLEVSPEGIFPKMVEV
ncbi:MAG: metallophosphoesterase [Christensenellaceae bacterium]|nr:metallophosphoesterase [Christensenellaceae bacterium]